MFNKKKRITRTSLILFIVVVLLGLLVMLYPIISSKINYSKSLEEINNYTSYVAKNPSKVNEDILSQAERYNSKIIGTNIADSFADEKEESGEYLGQLNVNSDGIMGYIKIPKIDVEIPIYHGTTTKTLQRGVGHLEGSSLPIGGKSSHTILSGHRGLPSSKLFTDLDQLRKGDMFYIYVLDEVLAYEVDQIKVVEPSSTEDLAIVDGEDYTTLVTCTPYAINTHRLLVRGKRVEYKKEVLNNIKVSKKISTPDIIFFGGLIISMIIVLYTVTKIMKLGSQEDVVVDTGVLNTSVLDSHEEKESRFNFVTADTMNDDVNDKMSDSSEDKDEKLDEII